MATVVMVSGGLDSFLASALYPSAVQVFVEWGQPYLSLERGAVERLYPQSRRVVIDGLPDPSPDYYVPARNLMFATIGSRFGDQVCFAGMRDEMCADKSLDAFRAMSVILTEQCKNPVTVFSPFWNHTKAEAVRDYLQKGGNPEHLKQTASCYGVGQEACLDCEACFRRFVALRANEVDVPRPKDSVIQSYGLNRLASAPIATVYNTLKALHLSGTPVHAIELSEQIMDTNIPYDGLRVVYTRKRGVSSDLIQRTLVAHGYKFDVVLIGASPAFFQFSSEV